MIKTSDVIIGNDYVIPCEELLEKLKKLYEHAEAMKLLTWDVISCEQWMEELNSQIDYNQIMLDSEAGFDGKTLRITVNDVLPRAQRMKPAFKSATLLRDYWLGNIVQAIQRIQAKITYDRALCVIKVYAPSNRKWDVDNRAVGIIINALRLAQVIKGDTWDKMSLLLLGGVDKAHPRTEITVMEYPVNVIEMLLNGTQ